MIPRNFEHPIQVGMSFGLVSGVITSLGLVVGLTVGTQSQIAVIGGIVTIAVADSLSEGNYEIVINAVVDDSVGNPVIVSPLTIEIDVTCQPPTWSINPADYEYTMTAIIELALVY